MSTITLPQIHIKQDAKTAAILVIAVSLIVWAIFNAIVPAYSTALYDAAVASSATIK